jgi:hypothetical protein
MELGIMGNNFTTQEYESLCCPLVKQWVLSAGRIMFHVQLGNNAHSKLRIIVLQTAKLICLKSLHPDCTSTNVLSMNPNRE